MELPDITETIDDRPADDKVKDDDVEAMMRARESQLPKQPDVQY
jgi:hypothetical protein